MQNSETTNEIVCHNVRKTQMSLMITDNELFALILTQKCVNFQEINKHSVNTNLVACARGLRIKIDNFMRHFIKIS